MGKLLIGHYGQAPEAESITISLRDCHQRLSLKPSDFVSADEPNFFRKAHKAMGKYLVFQVESSEVHDAVWRPGFYLLPLGAADVLRVFNKQEISSRGAQGQRPLEIDSKEMPAGDVMERINRWAVESQPLLFHCHCETLLLKLDAPSMLRRNWKVRLTCRKRCQPPLSTKI